MVSASAAHAGGAHRNTSVMTNRHRRNQPLLLRRTCRLPLPAIIEAITEGGVHLVVVLQRAARNGESGINEVMAAQEQFARGVEKARTVVFRHRRDELLQSGLSLKLKRLLDAARERNGTVVTLGKRTVEVGIPGIQADPSLPQPVEGDAVHGVP